MAINGSNLKMFRKRNSLKQNELAAKLGITRSFISMVEKDKSKLPKDQFERLLALSGINEWDIESLLPEYTRLTIALKYIADNGKGNPLTPQTLENLRLGEEELTSKIADSVTAACPSINRNWLLSGEGAMLVETEGTDLTEIRNMLARVLTELESSKRQLSELQDAISKLAANQN